MQNIFDNKTFEFINLPARLHYPVAWSKILNNINIFDVSTISYDLEKPIRFKILYCNTFVSKHDVDKFLDHKHHKYIWLVI